MEKILLFLNKFSWFDLVSTGPDEIIFSIYLPFFEWQLIIIKR